MSLRRPAPFSQAEIDRREAERVAQEATRQQILENARAAAIRSQQAREAEGSPALLAAQQAAREHVAKQEAAIAVQRVEQKASLALKVGEELLAQRKQNIESITIIGEESIWINPDYNQFNEDLESTKISSTISDLQKVKDTVHQQIFINSNIRTDLAKQYNCEIYFRRNNGRYAMFIIPKDTNYMINITNGISNNQERIFFNLSLKQADKTTKIKTEYISEYFVDKLGGTPIIYHKFGMDGIPPVLKKNKVDLNALKPIRNPYLILNNLLLTKIGPGNRISISYSLDLINTQINTINDEIKKRPGFLTPSEIEPFQYVKDAFKTEETKTTIDDKLKIEYKLFERFAPTFLRNKGIEDLDVRIPNKQLYITNNGFTEMLAFRYATYISDFEFTKSCNGEYTYTDPFPYKLASPFTATDIYLHRFDRHFNNDYAMDRYDLNTPSKLSRLADLVELSKSLMMSFISISYDIYSSDINNTLIHKLVNICPIYQELLWNKNKTPILNKRFSVYKLIQNNKITKIKINAELITDIPGDSFKLMTAIEIPYIGTFNRDEFLESCEERYNKKSVIPTKNDINSIEVQGIERFIMNNNEFNDTDLDILYEEFFNLERDVPAEESIQTNVFSFNTNEFPELNIDMQGVSRVLPPIISLASPSGIQSETLSIPPTAPSSGTLSISSVPLATATPSVPQKLASVVLTTKIPLASEISEVLVDIRKIKTPIKGETRKQRGERLKKLSPVLKELKKLRKQQLEEIQILGRPMPQSVIRQTRNLEEEGILNLSRYRNNYIRLKEQVDKNKTTLLEEADNIRIKCGGKKIIYTPAICAKMNELYEEKRKHDILIPVSHLERLSESGSISNSNFNKLSHELAPIKINITKLEEELKVLMETFNASNEEKKKRDISNAAKAQTKEEKETMRQETQLEEKKRADEELIRRVEREVNDIIRRGGELNKLIEIKRYKLYSEKYTDETYTRAKIDSLIKYAKDNIEKAIRDLRTYEYAIKDFAHARANPATPKEDLETKSKLFNEAKNASADSMNLFTEIEDILQNNEGENLMQHLEILYNRPIELERAKREREKSQRALEKTAKEAESIRQRIAEGERLVRERQEATKGLTEKEIKENAEAEFKKFRIWQTQNAKFIDELKQFKEDIKLSEKKLGDINTQISNTDKFNRLPPKTKKQKIEEQKELNNRIDIIKSALVAKNEEYNNFLLDNEIFIKTNENFRDPKYKAELLSKIEDYKKQPRISTLTAADAPVGMTQKEAEEWAALQKYLKYKYKYLQLKQKI